GPLARGEDALVIAAGPSIQRQDTARELAAAGFAGTIVAAESSMSWCLRRGIVPDLVVTVDPDDANARILRWFGDPDLTQASLDKDDYFARQDMDPSFARDQL